MRKTTKTKHQVHIYLESEKEKKALKTLAKKANMNMSQYLRNVIVENTTARK